MFPYRNCSELCRMGSVLHNLHPEAIYDRMPDLICAPVFSLKTWTIA